MCSRWRGKLKRWRRDYLTWNSISPTPCGGETFFRLQSWSSPDQAQIQAIFKDKQRPVAARPITFSWNTTLLYFSDPFISTTHVCVFHFLDSVYLRSVEKRQVVPAGKKQQTSDRKSVCMWVCRVTSLLLLPAGNKRRKVISTSSCPHNRPPPHI